MNTDRLLLLRGNEITDLFRQREHAIVEAVRDAYILKESGDVSIPNCEYLRFPSQPANRIIPKPAYLGGKFQTAGLKWIASFPANLERGLERASATIILNSAATGLPTAFLEGSVISAYRTAASAALAATVLSGAPPQSAGLIGCGLIHFETLRFLLAMQPQIQKIVLFDLDRQRTEEFAQKAKAFSGQREVQIASNATEASEGMDLVSLATTASAPHLHDLPRVNPQGLILHISLRDLSPSAILAGDNVVDDIEHVCTNRTSLDLTKQQIGDHRFIRATLGEILRGQAPARSGQQPVIFSPFGLGILDLAVAGLALQLAEEQGAGTAIHDFAPDHWSQRRY